KDSNIADPLLQHEMRSTHERQSISRADVIRLQELVHPGPRDIDHHVETLFFRWRSHTPAVAVPAQTGDRRHFSNNCPVALRRGDDGAHERSVIDLRVPVTESSAESFAHERRETREIFRRTRLMAANVGRAGQKIVKRQPDRYNESAPRTVVVDGQRDLDRLYELRCV